MPAGSDPRLTFVATARVASLLRARGDLDLCVATTGALDAPGHTLVLLATPADDLRHDPLDEAVRIAVLEAPPASFDDTRFDDYVFASASRDEFEFRSLRALRRKARAPITLEPMSLRVGSCGVPLSITEHRLLAQLLERPGAPVSRAELERAISEDPDASSEASRALDAHVYRLRRKLRNVPGIRLETLRQRGFSIALEALPRHEDRTSLEASKHP